MKVLVAIFVLAAATFSQSDLPDKGTLPDIAGKTKVYLSTDAKYSKSLTTEMVKAKLVTADKPDDAEFFIQYAVTEMRYVTDFDIPLETGQMDVYFFREGRKVAVWSESGSKSGRTGPAVELFKKFIKARK